MDHTFWQTQDILLGVHIAKQNPLPRADNTIGEFVCKNGHAAVQKLTLRRTTKTRKTELDSLVTFFTSKAHLFT